MFFVDVIDEQRSKIFGITRPAANDNDFQYCDFNDPKYRKMLLKACHNELLSNHYLSLAKAISLFADRI